MTAKYQDKFTEATKELSEKSAFLCESCRKQYPKQDAEKQQFVCCDRTLKELHQESFGP